MLPTWTRGVLWKGKNKQHIIPRNGPHTSCGYGGKSEHRTGLRHMGTTSPAPCSAHLLNMYYMQGYSRNKIRGTHTGFVGRRKHFKSPPEAVMLISEECARLKDGQRVHRRGVSRQKSSELTPPVLTMCQVLTRANAFPRFQFFCKMGIIVVP